MGTPKHSFHIADYSVFGVTIIVSLGIGLYYALSGGKQRTTSEYLVGNRRMMIIPVAISLMVSFESSIMMLGTPAEIYVYGLQWLIGNFGFFLANLMAIFLAVPLIHPLKITSAYEYLELRFKSHSVRLLGTLLGMLGYAGYMGIVLFGPAIALEGVTGFPQWASIAAVAGAAVIYTAIGGLKAVIWTDVFQCAVMFAGFFAVLIKGTMRIGGIGKTWEIAADNGRVNLFKRESEELEPADTSLCIVYTDKLLDVFTQEIFRATKSIDSRREQMTDIAVNSKKRVKRVPLPPDNFDPDPTVRHTFWNLFIGSIIRGFGLIFNQSSVQRISATPTISAATKVLLFNAPAFFISISLAGIEGIIAYAYYHSVGCDPLASKQISNPNQIIPYMVMDIFEGLPGMPGLFMASLFSASLSTLSSGLSSLSALFWTDLVKPHVKPMSEFRATIIAKLAVVFFGLMAVGIAFGIALVGGTLIQIAGSILSAVGGPLTGLFMLGAFIPFATAKGAFCGTLISAAFTFLLAIGQMTTPGSIKNTRLPSGPIDSCPAENATMIVNSTVMSILGGMMGSNVSSTDPTYILGDLMTATEGIAVNTITPEPTGFSRLFMLSYQWFGTVGILGTIVLGSIISIITGRAKPGEVDMRYVIPFYDRFFWFLPDGLLKLLRCGFDYSEKPMTNGVSTDLNNDLNVYNYEKVITENEISTEITTIAAPDSENHMSVSAPLIAKSFDDLIVPKFQFDNKEYEIIDLRRDTDADLSNSKETHIIIDRTVNSTIKLRAKSIEIDIPGNIPKLDVIPPTPDDEHQINELNSLVDTERDELGVSQYDNLTDVNAIDQNSQSIPTEDDRAKQTLGLDTPDQVHVLETFSSNNDTAEVEATQGLDDIETVELDETAKDHQTYGLTVVLNGVERKADT